MTALIVIGVIIAVILLIAVTRISVHIAYTDGFKLSVSVLGVTVYSNTKPKKEKKSKKNKAAEKTPQEKENVFKKTYKVKGLKYTVELVGDSLKAIFSKLSWLMRRLKIRDFKLSLSVVGGDAADTAIKYGATCAAIYPILSFIDAKLDFKPKNIDVYADFEGKNIKFSISTDIKAEVFVLVVLAIKCLKEYLKIKNRVETDLISAQNINNNPKKGCA